MAESFVPPDEPIGLVLVQRSPRGAFVAELLEPLPAFGTVEVARPIGDGRWAREKIPVRDVRILK